MKRDQDVEEEKSKSESDLMKSRTQIDSSLEFVASIRKDLMKLLKQVEKKKEQIAKEEEEDARAPTFGTMVSGGGRKLLMASLTETFKLSLDNIMKRIESFLYFSSTRY